MCWLIPRKDTVAGDPLRKTWTKILVLSICYMWPQAGFINPTCKMKKMSSESCCEVWMGQCRTSAQSHVWPSLGSNMLFFFLLYTVLYNSLPQGRGSCLSFLLYPQLTCSSRFSSLGRGAGTRCLANVCSCRVGYAINSVLTVSSQRGSLVSQHQACLCYYASPRPFCWVYEHIHHQQQGGDTKQMNEESKKR